LHNDGKVRERAWAGSGPWSESEVLTCDEDRLTTQDPRFPCTPSPADLAKLPTNADAMLTYLYEPHPDAGVDSAAAPDRAFIEAQIILAGSWLSPAVPAAVFDAVAKTNAGELP
jgi:hypothetical protein